MISAADPTDHVEQLVALTERLTVLIVTETRAFETRRPEEAARTLPETTRLANLYRQECLRLRRDPQAIAGVATELRTQLIRATETFEAALSRHGHALAAARLVTEGLVRAIAAEVAARRSPPAIYGPRARNMPADPSGVGLNRRA